MMGAIEDALHAALIADPAVRQAVVERIYPLAAPQDVPTPYLVYARPEPSRRFDNLSGFTGWTRTPVLLTAYGRTWDETRAASAAARQAISDAELDDVSGDVAVVGEAESYIEDPGLFARVLVLTVLHKET